MTRRFERKSVIVTGGGGGIGRAAARAFAQEGARVLVSDINEAQGQQTVRLIEETEGQAFFVRADVANEEDCQALVAETARRWGGLDVAFNNAGMSGVPGPVSDLSAAAWDEVVGVNLRGIFLCMKHEIAEMRRTGGGAIINTASVAGLVGVNGGGAYSASKHGVIGLTRSAALDHIAEGIRINAICPGATDTPMLRGVLAGHPPIVTEKFMETIPARRMADPDEIARSVLFLASDEASFMVGHALVVDGGETAH